MLQWERQPVVSPASVASLIFLPVAKGQPNQDA
jgi:hypothetical protein